ncbi:hypothetical protein MAPG_11536 [Magnaporthiopsis poae ATCC 64411]|uniref:Uncharacterized protein n=1 Tax=Magnaporthiopsis poae (strain ATCC 64411 / 73-15) TaxID=644358 RepID=A0A0C4EFI6_MAGP6|nr:hypothetical protein MAPG_11536 [Magnaporthiopsis poae ATCC 64411]
MSTVRPPAEPSLGSPGGRALTEPLLKPGRIRTVVLSAGTSARERSTPLQVAAYADPPTLKTLLAAGATFDHHAEWGGLCTLPFGAATRRSATLGGLRKLPPLQTMLGAGAFPVNCLALYRAAHCGDVSAMRLLLENGVDINKKGGTDGSPLQASSQSRKPKVLSFWKCQRAAGRVVRHSQGPDQDSQHLNPAWTPTLALAEEKAELPFRHRPNPPQASGKLGYPPRAACILERGSDVNLLGGKHGFAPLPCTGTTATSSGCYWRAARTSTGRVPNTGRHCRQRRTSQKHVEVLPDNGADARAAGS